MRQLQLRNLITKRKNKKDGPNGIISVETVFFIIIIRVGKHSNECKYTLSVLLLSDVS